jgi:hypothetical protein
MKPADDLPESFPEMLKRSLTLLGIYGKRYVEVIDRAFDFLGTHGVGRHCGNWPVLEGQAGPGSN